LRRYWFDAATFALV